MDKKLIFNGLEASRFYNHFALNKLKCYIPFLEQASFLPSRCVGNNPRFCKDVRCDGEWGLGSPNKFGRYKMLDVISSYHPSHLASCTPYFSRAQRTEVRGTRGSTPSHLASSNPVHQYGSSKDHTITYHHVTPYFSAGTVPKSEGPRHHIYHPVAPHFSAGLQGHQNVHFRTPTYATEQKQSPK
jgi:hypothetical protein